MGAIGVMKRYAVFIGINNYSNNITPLTCACNDATKLYGKFCASGFSENSVLILNDEADSIQIRQKVRGLCERMEEGDLLVFYFAGHGREYNGEHYLIGRNGEADAAMYSIDSLSVSMLVAMTNKPGIHRLFILDCCRDNLLAGRSTAYACAESRSIALNDAVKPVEGFLPPLILSSCAAGEKAFEDRQTMHGFFTKALLKTLSGPGIKNIYNFSKTLYGNMNNSLVGNEQHIDWRGNLDAWADIKIFPSWDQHNGENSSAAVTPAVAVPDNYYDVQWDAEKWNKALVQNAIGLSEKLQKLQFCAAQAKERGDYPAAIKSLQEFAELAEKEFNIAEEQKKRMMPDFFEIDLQNAAITGLKNKSAANIEIPDGVTTIAANAFRDCTAISTVVIPGSVTAIGDRAFSGCTSLASVQFNGLIAAIGDFAFNGCSRLGRVIIPQSCRTGESAFPEKCQLIRADSGVFGLLQQAAQGNIDINGQYQLGCFFEKHHDFTNAVKWYEKAAENNHPDAQFQMGICCNRGEGVTKDPNLAFYWFKKAANQDHTDAQFYCGCYELDENQDPVQSMEYLKAAAGKNHPEAQYYLALCFLMQEDHQKAAEYLEKAAQAGIVHAQTKLGNAYEKGIGVKKDPKQAFYWYKKAAEKNDSEGQHCLAECYYFAVGTAKSLPDAFFWYEKAAKNDHDRAQYSMGWCYEHGEGTAKNPEQAFYWYGCAARQGHTEAQAQFAKCYYLEIGTKQSLKDAIFWYEKAAVKDHLSSQFALGICYSTEGPTQNFYQAFAWYEKAANQGHINAMCSLAACYHDGTGTLKDLKKAAFWYEKAAGQGNENAQFSLANCYFKGEGVGKNLKKAAFWYEKAAGQGNENAQFSLANCYFKGEGVSKDLKKAVYWFEELAKNGKIPVEKELIQCYAELGDADAQTNLADWFYNGQSGFPKDFAKAFSWYEKAAKQKKAYAQYSVAWCYAHGEGVKQNFDKAVSLYKKAIKNGYDRAQQDLDNLLQTRKGSNGGRKKFFRFVLLSAGAFSLWYIYCSFEKDLSRIKMPFRKSFAPVTAPGAAAAPGTAAAPTAEEKTQFEKLKEKAASGDAEDLYQLGMSYYNGSGTGKNFAAAVKHLEKAADKGHVDAQLQLGRCFWQGSPVKDLKKSVWWYEQAANQGNPHAQLAMGRCYENGVPEVLNKDLGKAARWYDQAADNGISSAKISALKCWAQSGSVDAQYQLAAAYERGEDTATDLTEALKWYKEAAANDHVVAQYTLAQYYEEGKAGVSKDLQTAYSWYQKAAAQLHAPSQYKVGEFWAEGKISPRKNQKLAVKWYQQAADQEYAPAQNSLGYMYEKGHGVTKDTEKAVYWYEKAARQGNAKAQCNLAICYYNGIGTDKDYQQALEWARKSADQNYAAGQNVLGVFYERGLQTDGIYINTILKKDPAQAVYWYEKAAKQGNSVAQNNLGVCYLNGVGVRRDYRQAFYWFQESAKQGYSPGQYNLGYCYFNGLGTNTDYYQAVYWYQESAKQDNAGAMNNLGICYQYGRGVDKDLKKAKYWFEKAVEKGDTNARSNLQRLQRGW